MYGKIFASMFKGSLYGQWEAIVTFTVMIVLADQNGEVDMTPEALAAATSIPLEIIRKGIADLEQPDPQSRTPDEEGRRIVRVSESRAWGWTITNHAHYRAIRTAEERREYFKQYKRKTRAKRDVTDGNASQPLSTTSPQIPPIAVSSKQKQKAGTNGDHSKASPDTTALLAIAELRNAVWTAGYDGTRKINWDRVSQHHREKVRTAFNASGWTLEEFDAGKDFGNSKKFIAVYVVSPPTGEAPEQVTNQGPDFVTD